MPELSTQLHLGMHKSFRKTHIALQEAVRRGYGSKQDIEQAIAGGMITAQAAANGRLLAVNDLIKVFGEPRGETYGMNWGDPEVVPPLAFVKKTYLMPHVRPSDTGLEIGPGGGRWTQYLLRMKKLYVVDFHREILEELAGKITAQNVIPIHNNGTDFPGVPDAEVDFLFSFGVFVHLEPHIIVSYLQNMRRVLKSSAKVLIQYSDKTKIMAANNPAFVNTTADSMRKMVSDSGYTIVQEDNTTMWHSNIMLFCP